MSTNLKEKILLVYPPSSLGVFSKSKISVAVPSIPYISLASLAGSLLRKNHDVRILDLGVSDSPEDELIKTIKKFKPQYAGISFTSALSVDAATIAKRIKEVDNKIKIIVGGVHSTTLPLETINEPAFDFATIGEGEEIILDIIEGKDPTDIPGIAYKSDGISYVNSRRPLISNLDDLPMPAWNLYDIKKYKTPRISAKLNPVGAMETSRGCPFNCCFCNKTVFDRNFRAKSPERVVEEMEKMLEFGFREIHIWEDGFSTDMDRAKRICKLIIKRGLKFPWNIYNGIRVDRIDEELLILLKQAGCYRVSIGIESGNEAVLSKLGKNITLNKVREAAKLIKKVQLESLGFFMFGLPGDTEESMQDTINFGKELKLDLSKAGILMPLPGTPVFADWDKQGLIHSKDWSKYIFHDSASAVYQHPNLEYKTIRKYYDKFYRQMYLSPSFIAKRFLRGIKTGDLFWDAYYFLKTLPSGWFRKN